jgi:TonB family protein
MAAIQQKGASRKQPFAVGRPLIVPTHVTIGCVLGCLLVCNLKGDVQDVKSPATATTRPAQVPPGSVDTNSVHRVGSGVSKPTLISKVEPEYSQAARKLRVEGAVVLYAVILPDGTARNFRVVRSLGYGLDQKAIEAASQWKFKPGMKDTQAVSVAATIEVNFRLLKSTRADTWFTGPMAFVPDAGIEPPVALDGAMPKAGKEASDESAVLEFTVGGTGEVTDIRAIHGSKPASELLARSLATWRFQPATKGALTVESRGRVRFIKGQGDDAAKLPLFEGRETPGPGTSPAVADGGAGFTSPKLLHRVEADYTDAARNARLGGVVTVQILVDEKGNVADAKVITGLGYGLDEKALEAVRKWKFDAARQNGQPVAATIRAEIKFRAL